MKSFDMCELYVVYRQIGDIIYARLAKAEDFQKKGTDYLEETFGRPAVKTGRYTWEVDGQSFICYSGRMCDKYHGKWRSADGKKRGGMECLYNVCRWQMKLLPRDRQLLEYPIFPEDDLEFRDLYALAVWTEAVRDLRHGVTYPEDALNLAEKAAKDAAEHLEVSIAERPKFPIQIHSGWYVADSMDIPGAENLLYITRAGDAVYADPVRPAIISRGEKEEYAFVRVSGKLWRISSLNRWGC